MTTSAPAKCWFLRVGFRCMPRDAVRAAVASATICYQPALARRYVLGLEGHLKGRLPGEIAVIDTRSTRTQAVRQALGRAALLTDGRCSAVTQGALKERAQRDDRHRIEGLRRSTSSVSRSRLGKSPSTASVSIQSSTSRLGASGRLRLSVHACPRAVFAAVLDCAGRRQTKAVRLNATGIGTVRGGLWMAENVRKLAWQLPPGEVRA
ncbi:hypothetical protein ASG60_18440 [Methylobacterium sp. Leaf469]|uniref:hypothetical protein n=1 Tax=Methylobacterium sp. Leaf469 TaxID=1736387 RepID=UPI0006F99FE9|nr:hypothetical protein [Methylobacterium sp. Leaf469]KQU01829.1 hypothetical protein ASG60_18440 [Methylobacterium sp. Leaf469]